MAKRQPEKTVVKTRPKGRPNSARQDVPRRTVLAYRSTPEHHEWLNALTNFALQGRKAVNQQHLLEEALIDYARKIGFEPAAPLR
jgi:hypothetical protein